MLRKLEADLQALVAGQLLIEIAVLFLCFREAGKPLDLFYHARTIGERQRFPKTNHEAIAGVTEGGAFILIDKE